MTKFYTAEEAFSKIESFTNLEKAPNLTAREYRLDRMYRLLDLFDQPQRSFRSVHVAGSKGKGSTAAFIAGVLNANGYRTGLYCSPHVVSYKERISEAGSFFEDSVYAETASEMFTTIENTLSFEDFPGGPPTTFELLTLLSFLIFKKTGCDRAVFETGLGGRLDATNVIIPEASVLTIIELEHTEYLGNTIAEIAGEKAGIIKSGVPVFSADQRPEAEKVFRKVAAAKGSTIFFPGDLIKSTGPVTVSDGFQQAFRMTFKDGKCFDIQLRSAGGFQIKNAALAVSVLKHIMPGTFNPAAGIGSTVLPGRMELIKTDEGTSVILDGAHTVESVSAAAAAFGETTPHDAGTLIFGAVSGKDVRGMAAKLAGFRRIIISTPGSFKKSSPAEVYNIFREVLRDPAGIMLIADPEEALKKALEYHSPVFVTGSFYMVAEIRKLLV